MVPDRDSGVVARARAQRVRRNSLTHETAREMITRIRALIVAIATFAAAPLHSQTAPATPGPSAGTAPSPAKPAAAPISYDRTGVGDTSMFAPLELTAPNIYRAASGAPGP